MGTSTLLSIFKISVIILSVHVPSGSCLSCHSALTVVQTGRVQQPSGTLIVDGYSYPPKYYERFNETHFTICVCEVRQCVRKCCPLNKVLNSTCTYSRAPFLPDVYNKYMHKVNYSTLHFFLIYGDTCKSGKYLLAPEEQPGDKYYFMDNGTLYLPNGTQPEHIGMMEFCLEIDVLNNKTAAARCFPETPIEDQIFPYGMIISVPFLIATFLVYASLPELQNIHGKNLMCQVAGLAIGYIFLIIVDFKFKTSSQFFCKFCAYVVQLSFLTTFFWLNVMSFDIWSRFCLESIKRKDIRSGKDARRFTYYSIYAWGMSLLISGVTMFMDLTPGIPDYFLKPDFGSKKCWFDKEMATLAYFYGPVVIILMSNIMFFVLTAKKIFSLHQETAIVRMSTGSRSRRDEENKKLFYLTLKLFLIMGVNWVMEVVSWAVEGPNALFYITDTCNSLQGVLVFWMCVIGKMEVRRASTRLSNRLSSRFSRKSKATSKTTSTVSSNI